ncbi:hypothetical protein SAMN05216188_105107 [Lentzea xinjiangensis]|uniref:Uncharacterized protein n=1 Tax=Lentzea xinjiangensis TaxID=402600 RepID=A0A1H9IWH2_9PSEU|nr:hypothetical protein SAMN05216188_105107 [Lentzea xinjiangensis]
MLSAEGRELPAVADSALTVLRFRCATTNSPPGRMSVPDSTETVLSGQENLRFNAGQQLQPQSRGFRSELSRVLRVRAPQRVPLQAHPGTDVAQHRNAPQPTRVPFRSFKGSPSALCPITGTRKTDRDVALLSTVEDRHQRVAGGHSGRRPPIPRPIQRAAHRCPGERCAAEPSLRTPWQVDHVRPRLRDSARTMRRQHVQRHLKRTASRLAACCQAGRSTAGCPRHMTSTMEPVAIAGPERR